jgi:hypothetical protein
MNSEGGSEKSGFNYIFQIFLDTIRLDIWDINFFFSDPNALEWSLIQLESPKNRFRKGFFIQMFLFFSRMARCFYRLFIWKLEKNRIDKPIVFLGLTKNQIDSLTPVYEKTKDFALIIDGTRNSNWNLLIIYAYLASLFFFPFALKDFITSNGVNKKGIGYNLAFHWLTYGMYFVVRVLLHKIKIKAVVLANDHIMETRVVLKAAKDEEIITFYMQHASVTRVFPPLNVNYALLEGSDALEHYEAAGLSNTEAFLIGSPRFDHYVESINTLKKLESLGVCVNLLDPYDRVINLLTALQTRFPEVLITLRIHPREKNRGVWEELSNLLAIGYSDSLREGVYDFLKKVDTIIAGNSNVHLDAAMLNVFPIYYDFPADRRKLYYSFLQKGLCNEVESISSACDLVEKLILCKPNIRKRAKEYIDTINSKFDGHSCELATRIICESISTRRINKDLWQRIPGSKLSAFRLLEIVS